MGVPLIWEYSVLIEIPIAPAVFEDTSAISMEIVAMWAVASPFYQDQTSPRSVVHVKRGPRSALVDAQILPACIVATVDGSCAKQPGLIHFSGDHSRMGANCWVSCWVRFPPT